MPLQLLSRTTTDTVCSRSPSPLSTPASKPQIPTIRLTTATPCTSNGTEHISRVAPWVTSDASPVPIAPKPTTSGETSRKRLVPKKSKLGLLGSSSAKAREQGSSNKKHVQDASINSEGNGFEIYVDPTNDPEIGEILMVKKKKSRLGLDGLQWGTLGEVTNVPSAVKPKEKEGKKESLLKTKADENQKWWSINRGRKDSKEKDKEKGKDRIKPLQPTDEVDEARQRYNSLDSGTLLTGLINGENHKPTVETMRIPTPPSATRAPPNLAEAGSGKGSVALRAMRSVRSLARIGSWAQLKNTPNPDPTVVTVAPIKDKETDGKKRKKKRDKEKEKAKETFRYSGSSFEAGALSASPVNSKHESRSLGKKKASILGLGLPSTIRLPSSRSGSTASSVVASNSAHRLSADSANLLSGGILARGRSGSTRSTTSSLRPLSATSCVSRQSSGSSGAASVRWDEAGLKTVKEICRKEKERRSKEKEESTEKKKKSKKSKSGRDSTRKSSDSRKRTPLSAIFPGAVSEHEENTMEQPPLTPVVTIEEATVDGHTSTETPIKRTRSRPASGQPIGRGRPKPLCEGNDDNAVISLLDAATNDLAQLINRLDLEATPGSIELTPMSQHSPFMMDPSLKLPPNNRLTVESPVKGLHRKNSSMSSIRPYAQSRSRTTGVQLGRNIAPWSTLNASISPSKPSPSMIRMNAQDNMATVRTHGRTETPAPAVDPSPVFKALRPATTRLPISNTVVSTHSGVSPFVINPADRSPSALTFGSGHSKSESRGSFSLSPVFKKAQSLTRKRSSLSQRAGLDGQSLPILPDARRSLGLTGTMGGSVGSIAEQDCEGSDPDSDIPDELQVILSNSDQEDTMSFRPKLTPPSPGSPPELPLPVLDISSLRSSLAENPIFRASVVDDDEHRADMEEAGTLSEDDTKKSFDFTGELQKLNESGASDRRSFIEQLENAFRTPAKVDIRCDFTDLPPIPRLPTLRDELSQLGDSSFSLPIDYESRELLPSGFPIDVNADPSLLPGSDSFATTASDVELLKILAPEVLQNTSSVASRPSNGQLNRDFKFGRKQSASSKNEASLLTLSDIIPPPEIARSLSMASFSGDESSLMNSILAHAIEIESPRERPRLDSDASSKLVTRNATRNSYAVAGHQRNGSGLSFAGFDSFAEIRRGFEFNDSRPGFYPPASMSDRRHRKHGSFHSIASVSSYGNVLHSGSADPFDYASVVPLPILRERPSSDDFSFTMSSTVDDTFAHLRRPHRRRVDSDASSFYFRASIVHPYNRNHRRPESGISIGPPISLFNRNSTYRRRADSNASMSSVAQSYANCKRFSWNRHRSNFSVESVFSDFSGSNIARPGLGDKMLDSALEDSAPLVSISPSPVQSLGSVLEERVNRTSFDSLIDSQYESQKTDSLFEKTGHRNSVCSTDSTFFEQDTDNDDLKPPRYRPISSLSIPSVHSPPKDDDTMISMLGGGHVRRRSVTSMIGSSPCMQVERRKNILVDPPETVFSRIQKAQPESCESPSPKVTRVIEPKLSIASTIDSSKFGDERMIRAKHGLLERQSLENTVLTGDGEDLSASFRMPVFTRPSLANRSRSSTCTSSSGADTPPLSISDGYSSFSEGSLSSIDLSHLNSLLSNTTHPLSSATFDRACPLQVRSHRRRISQARASRTSLYETIEEEHNFSLPSLHSPAHSMTDSISNTVKFTENVPKVVDPPQVYIIDSETSSVDSFSLWDDERGIAALRRYYALRDEAEDAITESKQTWSDTPFSVFAVQSFDPPRHPSGMQALLEHSLQNFGPLPSDLRSRRSRTRLNSRPSPYPRIIKTSFTSSPAVEHRRATIATSLTASPDIVMKPRQPSPPSNALQQITIDPNVPLTMSAEPKDADCIMSIGKPERVFGLPPRPGAGSTTRRAASGLPKRSNGRNGTENKENVTSGNSSFGASTVANISQGTMATPSDGLRLNRPRPKGRPTPATVRPIRA